jgi:hypothetical protein
LNHTEAFKLDKEKTLQHLFNNVDKIFVPQKKEALYHFPYPKKLYDINFIEYINLDDNIVTNKCTDFYYRHHYKTPIVNSLIPISKHYEEQETIFDMVLPVIHKYSANDAIYRFNNELTSVAFHRIEKNGIALNKQCFISQYLESLHYPEFNIHKGKIYTQYNLYTTTSRPSNRFNGINFAALNKTDNERVCYEPSNNAFIEMDFSGYHPRLIGELIGFPLIADNIYESLNVGKEEMFQNLYGGIRKEYKDKPFFKEASSYVDGVWKLLNSDGKIHTINKTFKLNEIDTPNPTKIFNSGDRVRVKVTSNKSGYITVSAIAPDGSVSLISEQKVNAGSPITVPEKGNIKFEGQTGVENMIRILNEELKEAMLSCGVYCLEDIKKK